MGCINSKVNDVGEKSKPAMVPNKERKCRDVFWLLLFIAYWVGMVIVAISAVQYGDAARLLYAVDAHGNQCGGVDSVCVNNDTCGKYIVYPRIDKDLLAAMESGVDITDPTEVLTVPFTGYCVSSCPDGLTDVNEDGYIHDWVCDYDAMDLLLQTYDAADGAPDDIPSGEGREVLQGCFELKGSFPFAELTLTDSEDNVAGYNDVACKTYMSSCYKMYVQQSDLFFRCIPQTETNSTCLESPYLTYYNESVTTMVNSDGETVARPSTNEFCGKCIDPEFQSDGTPTDPSSELCKAKRTSAQTYELEESSNPVFDQINSWTSLFTRWLGDVTLCKIPIVVSGGAIAIILGCIWLVLLRFFAGTFVWLSIWGLLACFAFLTIQFLIQGNVISVTAVSDILASITGSTDSEETAATVVSSLQVFADQDASQEKLYRILGYVMLGITVVFLLLILTMVRKIRLAIGVLKEATKVVAAMPTIMLFPILSVSASLAVSAYALYISMLIYSSGEITITEVAGFNLTTSSSRRLDSVSDAFSSIANTTVAEFTSSNTNTWLFVYNFFGYLWTSQLIIAISATTVAGAVSSWYWASEFEKEKKKKMPKRPVLAALRRTFRFHLGSLAFGAFIIAVVQLIRAALAYIDKQTQTLQKKNKMIKYIMMAVQCCLWCFEKILKFITKNAYIIIALKGSSFCTATRDGFVILITNFAKIGVATSINNLMLLIAKLVITAGSGTACYVYVFMVLTGEDAPSSAIVPTVVTGILAWFVASSFMSVYALAVDTIMICFCEDEKRNDGSPNRPYYMSNSLLKITRKSNKIYDKEQAVRRHAGDGDDGDDDNGDENVAKQPSEPTLQPKSPSKAPML